MCLTVSRCFWSTLRYDETTENCMRVLLQTISVLRNREFKKVVFTGLCVQVSDGQGGIGTASLEITVSGGGTTCDGVPTWDAFATYNPPDRVVHLGDLYESISESSNAPPDYLGNQSPWWTLIGPCSGLAWSQNRSSSA